MENTDTSSGRGHWAGKLGFILAAAGSAVGLGNLWKFPWKAYECGGMSQGLETARNHGAGAFVLVYLAAVLLVGLPVMIGEIVIGRRSGKDPVGAFKALRPGTPWKIVGGLGVLTGFLLLSYYGVVAGWSAFFFVQSGLGNLTTDAASGGTIFSEFTRDPFAQVAWMGLFVFMTAAVVIGGVSKGIERVSKVLMPALFLMLLYLFVKVIRMPGASEAFTYLFHPDFSVLTPSIVLDAMGQAFFSLSLGMGAVITYGSYLGKTDDIGTSALSITLLDTFVALFAALILFGVLFHLDMEIPGGGEATLFTAIPAIFSRLEGGAFMVAVFFLLVVFAALTSTVSLLEVVVAYFIDQRGWPRKKAVTLVSLGVFVLGIPSALSFNLLSNARLSGRTFFDWFDHICSNWLLPVGGFFITLFAGWILTRHETSEELAAASPVFRVWSFCIRYVAPVVVFVVLLGSFINLD